ncbi:hypothetical protein ADUPG1_014462, partial [Aduncisulcus paluster]
MLSSDPVVMNIFSPFDHRLLSILANTLLSSISISAALA